MPTPHPQSHEVVRQNQLSPAPDTTPDKNSTAALNRRRFLARMSGLTAITLAAEATGQLPRAVGLGSVALAEDSPEDLQKAGRSGDPKKRANAARTLRKRAATAQRRVPLPDHPINGDEERYGTKIGNFTKALPRRLRPEEFAGRLHQHKMGSASYPISPEILNSPVLDQSFAQYDSYLLPMGYPEGCPAHSAYPAGHAAIAGACVTMLKAFFKETFVLPNPVIGSADGLSLLPYSEASLTIGCDSKCGACGPGDTLL